MSSSLCCRFVGDNTLANVVKQGQHILLSHSDSAMLDAQILLSFVLEKPRSYLLTWPEKTLNQAQFERFLCLISRRYQGEPIAYIVGEKEFWSLPFKVSPSTLIPRPDTETLVELVVSLYKGKDNLKCLDLGTGTGAIALALASEQPNWDISAVDFNEEAVKLAQSNALNLGFTQVNIYQSDWFSQVSAESTFDLIVSNPPYIDENDVHLEQGDVRYEPKSALVSTSEGLADINLIATKATEYLSVGGALFFEHGFQQGPSVRAILSNLGYSKPNTVKDLNGLERITWALWS